MLRFFRSLRLQRGGGQRAFRVGVVAAVVLVWVWVYLVNQPAHEPAHSDWSSRSPNLQVAAPISDPLRGPAHTEVPRVLGKTGEKEKRGGQDAGQSKIDITDEKLKKEQPVGGKAEAGGKAVDGGGKAAEDDNFNPRYNRVLKDRLAPGSKIVLPGKRFDLPGADLLMEEEEEEEEEEDEEAVDEEGKWKGRNLDNDDDNNHAMEEDDAGNHAADDDDVRGQEDVGGEELKRKKKRKKKKKGKKKERQKRRSEKLDEKLMLEKRDDQPKEQRHNLEASKKGPEGGATGKRDLDLLAVEKIMEKRRNRVKEVCARYGLGPHASPRTPKKVKHPPTPNYETFYIDRADSLAWCPVYKAASTSWLYAFLNLAGLSESYVRNTKEQVSSVARRVWPSLGYPEAQQALDACYKFIIVRHPFERLASAYRDKLETVSVGEEHGTKHFYQKYGKKIVEKYRSKDNQPLPQPPGRYSHILEEPNSPASQGIEPTFAEFVRYLIDTDLAAYADDHWLPYYLSCTPCLVDYDVIAKFDTLFEDQYLLVTKTHLEKKVKPSWKHLTKGKKTGDVVSKYFSTITKQELMSLYKKYRLDFEMFDYSIDEYLGYVMPS